MVDQGIKLIDMQLTNFMWMMIILTLYQDTSY